MEEVERGHATDQTAGDSDPDITDLLQEALTQIETSFDRRLTLIEQRAMRIDDVIHWLEMIDRRVRALDEALPRRPSSARLAAAIVAALTLGAAAGIALTHWQPEARVSQVVSASAK